MTHPVRPEYRIADLVWYRESKNGKLWWPAMVTYEPNTGLFFRLVNKCLHYHVQFFGDSPMRAWASTKALKVLNSASELTLPEKGVSKKYRRDHSIAITEVKQALKFDHKERKLHCIFNFDSNKKERKASALKEETTKSVRRKRPRDPSDELAPVRTVHKQPKITDGLKSPDQGTGVSLNTVQQPSQEALHESQQPHSPKKVLQQSPRNTLQQSHSPKNIALPCNSAMDPQNMTSPQRSGRQLLKGQLMENSMGYSPVKSGLSYPTPVSPTLPFLPLISLGSPPLFPPPYIPPFPQYPVSQQGQGLFSEPHFYPPLLLDPLTVTLGYPGYVPMVAPSPPQPFILPTINPQPSINPQPIMNSQLSINALEPHTLNRPQALSHTLVTPIATESVPDSTCPEPVKSCDIKALSSKELPSQSCVRENCTDCGSEMSAPSAILTPPTSGSETDTETLDKINKPIKCENVGVCAICDDKGTDLLACSGRCHKLFHLDCLGLVVIPQFKFVCDECLLDTGKCFVCGKPGEVLKCSKARCSKLYHLSCTEGNKLFVFDKSKKKMPPQFTCPLHTCGRCASIGVSEQPSSPLIQCIQCPLALHKNHCLIAGCQVLSSTSMLCYQHLKISKQKERLYSHINLNTCMECGKIGELYCCDMCSAAYHLDCLDIEDRPRSDIERWKCPSCAVHDLPTYGSLVICKFGKWRWWPAVVVEPRAVPDNIEARSVGECMFVVRFCGTRDYAWMHHGRVVPYTGPMDEGKGAGQLKAFRKALEEADQLHQAKRLEREQQEANKKPDSKRYIKIKTNKYLVPRPVLKDSALISPPCQCSREKPCNDCSSCVNRASLIECDPDTCPVGSPCKNQRLLSGQEAKTTPFHTGQRGWGLRVDQDLSPGDFVIEYIGEVLDMASCRERLDKYHENRVVNYYMLTLDGGLVIDASQKSNHARFINHSCDPNCESQKWTVRGETRIGIFALTNIKAGTELTFDYHLDSLGNEKKQCFCGSKNCSGFMGLKSVKVIAPVSDKPKKPLKRKRQKRKERVREVGPLEDRHEDECFLCGDGGELLLCDHKLCPKAYHLECLQRKVFPSKSTHWKCPRHFCQVCQKEAVMFCATCPMSYCKKHCVGKFELKPDTKPLCLENCAGSLTSKLSVTRDLDSCTHTIVTELNTNFQTAESAEHTVTKKREQ